MSLVFYKLKKKSEYDNHLDGHFQSKNTDKETLRKSNYDDPAGGLSQSKAKIKRYCEDPVDGFYKGRLKTTKCYDDIDLAVTLHVAFAKRN